LSVRIRFTPPADAQFLAALEYIRREDPVAAARFREKVERSLRRLARFAGSGRHIPEFPGLPHREVVLRPYRFFYRVERKVVWVIGVWHGAQLPKKPS